VVSVSFSGAAVLGFQRPGVGNRLADEIDFASLASIKPELVMLNDSAGESIVRTPLVASIVPVLVMSTLVMALMPLNQSFRD